MSAPMSPPVILFGYQSSPFTNKVRLCLKLKQVTYEYVEVPSMMPRPFLRKAFNLGYRKIPICAIGHDVYCDTSIILEALEHFFPETAGYSSLYPRAADGRSYRSLIRGFASYWTDRPLFRVTTGLIPGVVWRTQFGIDRAKLIGHKLDADKLERKVPQNLSALDLHLSILEPLFKDSGGRWIFSTKAPSAADVALYYQLKWGRDMADGQGIYNLTGGGVEDGAYDRASVVFNAERYPNIRTWFDTMEKHVAGLPVVEQVVSEQQAEQILMHYEASAASHVPLLPTAATAHKGLDSKHGLDLGTKVTVAPDDTGRADPTVGILIGLTPEEVVLKPQELDSTQPLIEARIHFPRLGFVIKPAKEEKL